MFTKKLAFTSISSNIKNSIDNLSVNTTWETGTNEVKEIKSAIRTACNNNQTDSCAYCELSMQGVPELDHIADKKRYPKETFNPHNLVYSCHRCNCSSFKGTKNTVTNNSGPYDNWEFNIVHPYFDDPTDYFTYIGCGEKESDFMIYIKDLPPAMATKAQNTINMFGLNDEYMIRARHDNYEGQIHPLIKNISSFRG